jgi:enterochelin esterase-like enzyme
VLAGAGALAEPRLRSSVQSGVNSAVHHGPAAPEVRTTRAGGVVEGSFDSVARRAHTGWSIAYPPGTRDGDALDLMLVLHGRSDDHRAVLGSHRLGGFLAEAVRHGIRPFALVGVDGGDHDYWHRRNSGADAQAMLVDELLPMLARRGLRTDSFAVGGWSMGGYGALLLAERLGPRRIAAVAVDSPAIWTRAADTAPGAFDSSADFAAHDVLGGITRLGSMPVRVTCGTSDPFLPGVRALLAVLPHAQSDIASGGHDLTWWQHAAPGQLAFVGRHLRAPGG